jgi:uncharacterized membrane protein (DUF2068 family)
MEVFELLRRPTPPRGLVLAINIGIVVYLSGVVVRRMRRRSTLAVEEIAGEASRSASQPPE